MAQRSDFLNSTLEQSKTHLQIIDFRTKKGTRPKWSVLVSFTGPFWGSHQVKTKTAHFQASQTVHFGLYPPDMTKMIKCEYEIHISLCLKWDVFQTWKAQENAAWLSHLKRILYASKRILFTVTDWFLLNMAANRFKFM